MNDDVKTILLAIEDEAFRSGNLVILGLLDNLQDALFELED